MARAAHPKVLEARVRPAAEVRASLRQRADVQGAAVSCRVVAREPAAALRSRSMTMNDEPRRRTRGTLRRPARAVERQELRVRPDPVHAPGRAPAADHAKPTVPASASTAHRPSAVPRARRRSVLREKPATTRARSARIAGGRIGRIPELSRASCSDGGAEFDISPLRDQAPTRRPRPVVSQEWRSSSR